jgi:hypothetical protein
VRAIVGTLAALALLAGCGGEDGRLSAADSTTTTRPTTSTTIDDRPTLTLEARRAVLLCVGAQTELASGLLVAFYERAEVDVMKTLCDEAQAYIDTEAPQGDNIPREIAVEIAEQSFDLSGWGLAVTTSGLPPTEPAVDGDTVADAPFLWQSRIDQLLDRLPEPPT